jgi:S-(hydroxymethyl)glutathione dehydrogenase/alcohol dehydrogenase
MLDGTRRLHRVDGSELHHFLGVAAFAEHAVVPEASVIKIPPALGLGHAALVGCAVLTGFGAVRNAAKVGRGATVCVIGCGGVGLQVITAARLAGAASITAVDRVQAKLDLATRHGATSTANGEDLEASFDAVFEVVGRAETIELAWRLVRPGGIAVVVGIAPIGVKAAVSAIDFASDKTLRGSFYGSGNPAAEVAELAGMAAEGIIDLTDTVTHTTDLHGIDEAFERMRRGEGARTLVILDQDLAG